MCVGNITGNIGNSRVKAGPQRALFNVIDPGGGLSNTMGSAEYFNKGQKENYKSNIMKDTYTPEPATVAKPTEQISTEELERRRRYQMQAGIASQRKGLLVQ